VSWGCKVSPGDPPLGIAPLLSGPLEAHVPKEPGELVEKDSEVQKKNTNLWGRLVMPALV
jgi:hypothetical protein